MKDKKINKNDEDQVIESMKNENIKMEKEISKFKELIKEDQAKNIELKNELQKLNTDPIDNTLYIICNMIEHRIMEEN